MKCAFITVLLLEWMFLSEFITGERDSQFTDMFGIGGMSFFMHTLESVPFVSSGEDKSSGVDFIETAFGINMKMVYVEGGNFLMGGTSEQGADVYDDEKTIRRVALGSYYIGAFEVTQGQWEKVMGNNPSDFKRGVDYPVEISWEDAQAFCQKLSAKTGKTYCLPTEAQWEYAARGGNRNDGTKYSGGESVDTVAWHLDNSGSSAHPVGMKSPNALGLYDMSGNVWEWCQDWYDYYRTDDTQNPVGASSGIYRVLRGGSWCDYARRCRVSVRTGNTPDIRSSCSGFRVVLIL